MAIRLNGEIKTKNGPKAVKLPVEKVDKN